MQLSGLVVGAVISSVTEYYTGLGTKPVSYSAKIKYGSGNKRSAVWQQE
jgi:Na+/H+-translocating membrane pyrophosphatase